jgi:DNA-binding NarL/FixJ family response regulator
VFEGGYRAARVSPLTRLADLRLRQGRLDEAEHLFEDCEWHPAARRLLAETASSRGRHALAEDRARLCLEAEDPSNPGCAALLGLLMEIQLARDRREAAAETLERLVALARGSADDRARAYAELATGRLRALEEDERAGAPLQAALEGFSALELPLEAARARLELARALASRAPDAAVAEGRLALRTFERLGAALDADRAAGLLRRLGAAGRTRPRLPGTLTTREREVLSLLAAGCSNAEIGERLYISRRTAEHHVASILSKLGLRNRAEAAAHALRTPPEEPVAE